MISRVHMSVCMHVCVCARERACVRACMHACVRACMHACMRVDGVASSWIDVAADDDEND